MKKADCDLSVLCATEVLAAIEGGLLSCEEVCSHYLQRIAERQEEVRAFVHLDNEAVLRQARLLQADTAALSLRGLPIAIKDLSDTADMPTSYGSPIYRGYRPSSDAACVAMARSAGAIVLGKAATVEFGASRACDTRNPHNVRHTPGGSSAGSAAAVADGQALLATGSQTGGSIIRPAAFCGVVGFKPTFGTLSPAGTRGFCWSLDTIGLFARNVGDATLFFGALRDAELQSKNGGTSFMPRVARFIGSFDAKTEPEMARRMDEIEDGLRVAGVSVTRLAPGPDFSRTLDWQRTISRYEMARSMAYEWTRFGNQLSLELQTEIAEGRSIGENEYRAAKAGARVVAGEIEGLFADYDVLLTYATPGEAPLGLETTGDATFNRSWSLLGLPCISLPAGKGPNGLPLAIQLVGHAFADEGLLRAARWIEEALRAMSFVAQAPQERSLA